jgi:hypothetical protein
MPPVTKASSQAKPNPDHTQPDTASNADASLMRTSLAPCLQVCSFPEDPLEPFSDLLERCHDIAYDGFRYL